MAAYVFDSSALIKRYIAETGTDWVRTLTEPAAGHVIYIARITGVEVLSAAVRRQKNGTISATQMQNLMTEFHQDFANEYAIVEITPALIRSAMTLTATHALRAYDAVQLAAVSEVADSATAKGAPAVTLVSSDLALNTAASAEGLLVEDPNFSP